jgi:hypothetical protein
MNKLLAYDFRVTKNAFSMLPVKVNTLTCLLVHLPACLSGTAQSMLAQTNSNIPPSTLQKVN